MNSKISNSTFFNCISGKILVKFYERLFFLFNLLESGGGIKWGYEFG